MLGVGWAGLHLVPCSYAGTAWVVRAAVLQEQWEWDGSREGFVCLQESWAASVQLEFARWGIFFQLQARSEQRGWHGWRLTRSGPVEPEGGNGGLAFSLAWQRSARHKDWGKTRSFVLFCFEMSSLSRLQTDLHVVEKHSESAFQSILLWVLPEGSGGGRRHPHLAGPPAARHSH